MSTHAEEASYLSRSTMMERLQKGLVSSFLVQLLGAANALLLVPLSLAAWGAEGYGHWLTLTALVAYLMLLDLGGQSYICNLLSMAYAQDDRAAFQRYWSEGMSLFLLITGSAWIIIIGLLLWPPLTIPGIGRPLTGEERWIIGSVSLSYLLSILSAVSITPYRATGRLARGAMIGNLTLVLRFVVLAGALLLGVGMVEYAVLTLLAVLFTSVVLWRDMQACIPLTHGIQISLSNAKSGRVHFKGSLYFWAMSLSEAINQQGVILVLAAAFSPAVVAAYATHRTISGVVRYPAALLLAPMFPEFGFLWGQQRLDEVRYMALLAIKVVVLASGAVVLVLWAWLPVVYPLWTSRELVFAPWLLGIFLLQVLLLAGWSTSGWALLATNQHRSLSFWAVSNAALTIIGALLLVKPLGMFGVALASLIGDIVCGAAIYPRRAAQVLELPTWKIYHAMLGPCLALLPIAASMALASLFVGGWWFGILSSLLGLLLAYPTLVLSLGKTETRHLGQRIWGRLPRLARRAFST